MAKLNKKVIDVLRDFGLELEANGITQLAGSVIEVELTRVLVNRESDWELLDLYDIQEFNCSEEEFEQCIKDIVSDYSCALDKIRKGLEERVNKLRIL